MILLWRVRLTVNINTETTDRNPTNFSKGRPLNVEIVRLKVNSEMQNEAAKVRIERGIMLFFSHHRLL